MSFISLRGVKRKQGSLESRMLRSVMGGIYSYKNFKIRDEFNSAIELICSKVKKVTNT
jgi:hypothetical protein